MLTIGHGDDTYERSALEAMPKESIRLLVVCGFLALPVVLLAFCH
jgi:hypothetical protein